MAWHTTQRYATATDRHLADESSGDEIWKLAIAEAENLTTATDSKRMPTGGVHKLLAITRDAFTRLWEVNVDHISYHNMSAITTY